MTVQTRTPAGNEGSPPGGWTAVGAGSFAWFSTNLTDYPDSSGTNITFNSTGGMYVTWYENAGSDFSIPSGATVNSVTLRGFMKKNGAASCVVRFRLYINGAYYNNGDSGTPHTLTTTSTEYVTTWSTNPATGAAWTRADLNSHSLTNSPVYIAFECTDATQDGTIYCLQFEVDYTEAATPADLTGTAALDGLAASGSMAPQPDSSLTGSATLDGLSAAGSMAMAPGTLTVPELRSWAGMLLTSQLVENIVVIRMSDRTLLCAFTNQTTNGTTGNLALSHAALAAGTLCMVVGYNPDGSARFARPVTVV